MKCMEKIRNILHSRRAKLEISAALGLLLAVFLADFGQFAQACDNVRQDTLRLHILANSDTQEDQELKLAVRDTILRTAGSLFAEKTTKQQAMREAQAQMPQLRAAAQRTVQQMGYDYPVTVRLENQYFRTREYEGFTLPAGRYDALRVEIGAHEGHNWFCVLFPPMCVPAAGGQQGMDAYTQKQRETVTGRYTVKFAAAELISYLRESLSGQCAFYENDEPFTGGSTEQSGGEVHTTGKARCKAD